MSGGERLIDRAIAADAAERGMTVSRFLREVYTLWNMERVNERARQTMQPVKYATFETEATARGAGWGEA